MYPVQSRRLFIYIEDAVDRAPESGGCPAGLSDSPAGSEWTWPFRNDRMMGKMNTRAGTVR